MMASIYRTLLREIEADGFQVLHQRIIADAAAQALDRDAHAAGAAAERDAERRRSPSSAPAGPAWPPRSRPTRAAHRVTLFEMAPHARRPRAQRRSAARRRALDNGQHILIGAYRETLRLMRAVGVDPRARCWRLPLRCATPDGGGPAAAARAGRCRRSLRGVLALARLVAGATRLALLRRPRALARARLSLRRRRSTVGRAAAPRCRRACATS